MTKQRFPSSRWRWPSVMLVMAVLAATVVSQRYVVFCPSFITGPRAGLCFTGGGIIYTEPPVFIVTGWPTCLPRVQHGLENLWFRHTSKSPGQMAETVIPIWPLGIPAVVISVLSWRRWMIVRRGKCRKCGYDLQGLVSSVCPECGRPFHTAGRRSATPGPPA